ncbi:MAG: hypothetical protein J4N99_07795 [Chloroflexi bacterium]|nr:hypothetical protein [Chloroflexota bacterium]
MNTLEMMTATKATLTAGSLLESNPTIRSINGGLLSECTLPASADHWRT